MKSMPCTIIPRGQTGEGAGRRRPRRAQSLKSCSTLRFAEAFGVVILLLALTAWASEPNQLTDAEKQAGWKLLFDGKTTKGWRGYQETAMPAKGWRVEDGILKKVGGERGGDIITDEKFNDFDLTWEWRISPAGNNGLKYLVTEDRPSAPGQEYQMIDDTKNPDAKIGSHRATGSFYDVLAPSDDKPLKPVGEWNQSRVLIRGNHVEHWLNGKKILEYELGSDALKAAVAKSKFKNAPGFGEKIKGHIMLTDHGDECWFRNIKIQELIGPIAVTGRVQNPGEFSVPSPATIQKALKLAGLGEFAGRGTEIVRANGKVERVPFTVLRNIKKEIPLGAGDKVIVRSWE